MDRRDSLQASDRTHRPGGFGPFGVSKGLRVKYRGSRSLLGKFVIIVVDTTDTVDEGSEDNNTVARLLSN